MTDIPRSSPIEKPAADAAALKTSRYRVPGEGRTFWISVASIVAILVLWWVATHHGWIKPLFLPKPETIWSAFRQAMAGKLDNNPLWVHVGWSLVRVISAFVLA